MTNGPGQLSGHCSWDSEDQSRISVMKPRLIQVRGCHNDTICNNISSVNYQNAFFVDDGGASLFVLLLSEGCFVMKIIII